MLFQRPQLGNVRYKKGFAILPISAGNQTVWLESYKVCQFYDKLEGGWYNRYFCDMEKMHI